MKPVVSMTEMPEQLSRFGFSFESNGAHASRTMMLAELEALLAYVDNPRAGKRDYLQAIDEQNCLGKRSMKTRRLTYRHLTDLYSLDNTCILFQTLRNFWHCDIAVRPLLALLCAYARDSIFLSTVPFLLKFPEGIKNTREALEEFFDRQEPDRFSAATCKSMAQNINPTWIKSGDLNGRVRKIRSRAHPSAGSVAYALHLGYLVGERINDYHLTMDEKRGVREVEKKEIKHD